MKHIVVLVGGAYFFDEKEKVYRASRTNENFHGLIGDVLRLDASAALYREYAPDAVLMVLGGRTPWHAEHPDAPVLSQVIKDELVRDQLKDYPNPKIDQIELHPLTGSFKQLLSLNNELHKMRFDGQVHIVSNRWQMARLQAFAKHHEGLTGLREPNVRFVSAEGYLLATAPEKYAEPIAKMYDMPEMHESIFNEMRGRNAVVNGTYVYPTDLPAR